MCIQDIDLCLSSVEFSLLPLIFSVMGPIVNISSFVGHVVSVCSAITSATIDKWTCSDKTLFANTGVGPDLITCPAFFSLPSYVSELNYYQDPYLRPGSRVYNCTLNE